MSTNLDIFDTFIAAKQALDELPRVRVELATARENLNAADSLLDDQAKAIAWHKSELETLKAALADKEVALAAATFRESEATRKIDSLRDILGAGVVSHRDPIPEPVAEEAKPFVTYFDMPEIASFNIYAEPEEAKPEPEREPEAKPEAENPADNEPDYSDPNRDPAPEVAEPIKQYAGKAYWQRPSNVTWAEWVNEGGEPSPWTEDAANF